MQSSASLAGSFLLLAYGLTGSQASLHCIRNVMMLSEIPEAGAIVNASQISFTVQNGLHWQETCHLCSMLTPLAACAHTQQFFKHALACLVTMLATSFLLCAGIL